MHQISLGAKSVADRGLHFLIFFGSASTRVVIRNGCHQA